MKEIIFGKNLKLLRLEKGLSQSKLAKKLNNIFTSTSVSRWERNICRPNFNICIELANFFNVSLDFLVGLEQ